MRAVIQRVSEASVRVGGQCVAQIGRGLVALVGIEAGDQAADRVWMAEKIVNLRIFEDAAGKMNLSLLDMAAADQRPGLLLVPNFTVAGDARKGRRPSFDNAMKPELSESEFQRLVADANAAAPGLDIQTGIFRADMKVALVNDGPVTILLDTRGSG
jgi:D-aminoacyl-tRNA deacylase